MAISQAQRKKYLEARSAGFSIAEAARTAKFSEATGHRVEKAMKTLRVSDNANSSSRGYAEQKMQNELVGPKNTDRLSADAKRALEDFDYFRQRYFGRISTPWQNEAGVKLVELLESPEKEYVVMNMPPGAGKALALDTPIPTPTGWTTMGELSVGDWVFDEQGKACRVTYKSEIFYDHDCYEVRTDDGHSVIADADHLWYANIDRKHTPKAWYPGKSGPKPKRSHDGFGTYDTRTLAKARNKRPLIPVSLALELPESELPIEPYTLGVWLGDGTSANANITAHDDDMVWLIPELQRLNLQWQVRKTNTKQRLIIAGGFQSVLRKLNLLNNKHVPAQYLRASQKQRQALLQGLVDTDGYVSENGHVEFCSTNYELATTVLELVHSLGVKANLKTGRSMLNGVDYGPKYQVMFYYAHAARMPRKAVRCRNAERTTGRYLTVTPVASVPTQCIQVDSPNHLFLAGTGMLVTHNTTLIHDLICWIICRNRRVRLMVGSHTQKVANNMVGRVRKSLERVVVEPPDDELIARGLAVAAESTMAHDFGRFKPLERDLWTREQFIVEQPEEYGSITEKEPTLSAFGYDSGYIGMRVNGIFWDDLVTEKNIRSADLKENLQNDWSDVAESRLEPGGMLALIGQRLAADDLYRFALDMQMPLDDEEELLDSGMTDEEIASMRRDKKYHHLLYKAHYEDRCDPEYHKYSSPAYPEGCLLDPRRLGWREIKTVMANRGQRFRVVYQQEDSDPDDVLVRPDWVWGHGDSPGCVDKDRDIWQIPRGLTARDCLVVATADPSPTQFWSIQLWIVHPESEQRFLIDHIRQKMTAADFLDYKMSDGRYTGVMEDWQRLSESLGFPIQYWVVEANAAQRFMLQYDTVKTWRGMHSVEIIPHNTNAVNKTDESLGVTVLQSHYRFGRVRLPGKGEGKVRSLKLIDEVTRYPNGTRTDDCVMAQWFLEWNLPNLYLPKAAAASSWRPSWVKSATLNMRL